MTWINTYQLWLTESQSLQNAQLIVDFLYTTEKDWSKESISAMIGNMRHESSVNPNMYEYGYNWSDDRGFGLVQWTPRSKYWDWALANGYAESDLRNGNAQLARIDYEVENNIQWIAVSKIDNLTFKEFRTNSRGLSLNTLTEAFTWGYERPNAQAGEESMPDRKAFANRAFNELDWSKNSSPDPEPDPDPDPEPDPEPEPEIDYTKFIEEFNEMIRKMITADFFEMGVSGFYKNNYLTLLKQMENTYKIKPNKHFFNQINDKLEELENIKPIPNPDPEPNPDPDPDPDPEPEPDETPILPMAIQNLYVTSEYGVRSGRLHDGIDLGVGGNPTGQPIYAVMSGTVRAVHNSCDSFDSWGCGGELGNHITIEHTNDSFTTRYIHLGQNSVPYSVGDTVKQGDQIGVMANSGSSQGIHLHFTVSQGYPIVRGEAIDGSSGTTVDPRTYITKLNDVPKT